MRTILLATIAAFALAATANITANAQQKTTEELLAAVRQANSDCRGKPVVSKVGQAACAERERLGQQLNARGLCWGPPNEIEANKSWISCSAGAQDQAQDIQQQVRRASAQTTVGPSFNCAAPAIANQPLPQLICSSDRIARAELSYIIAYVALRQISNDADRATMHTDANDFTARLTDECNIPKTGSLGGRSARDTEVNCLGDKFDKERVRLLKQLGGEAVNEAWLAPEQTIAIQRLLKEKGFLPENALLDGVFGPVTREAIGNWQRSNGQPSTGFGSAALLAGLQGSTPAGTPAGTVEKEIASSRASPGAQESGIRGVWQLTSPERIERRFVPAGIKDPVPCSINLKWVWMERGECYRQIGLAQQCNNSAEMGATYDMITGTCRKNEKGSPAYEERAAAAHKKWLQEHCFAPSKEWGVRLDLFVDRYYSGRMDDDKWNYLKQHPPAELRAEIDALAKEERRLTGCGHWDSPYSMKAGGSGKSEPVAPQDREPEKLKEQRLRRLATEQLDRALAEVAGSSPVTAAKRVAAAWDADRERCDASAKSREEKDACADMVIYGNTVAFHWLDDRQKDGETIYGVQECIHKPPAGMTSCDDRVVALPPAAQSEAGCRKFVIESWELDGPLDGVNDHYCKARAARGKPWVTVFSKTRQ